MKENKKFLQVFSVVALVVAVLGISVGFAAMSQTLTITGQVKVDPANWQVEFTGYTFSNNSTGASETTDDQATPPTPTLEATSFSDYEIVLTKPGDKGTYLVTVENLGDINAQLTSVNIGSQLTYTGTAQDATQKAADEQIVENNVTYTVTWQNGDPITTGATLNVGASAVIKIEAEYSSSATQLPSAPVVITGRNVSLIYTQAN